jgi:hypothetical protein
MERAIEAKVLDAAQREVELMLDRGKFCSIPKVLPTFWMYTRA